MDLITRKLTLDQVQLPDWATSAVKDSNQSGLIRKGVTQSDFTFVENERSAIFVATNSKKDRDGDIVVPQNLNLKHFKAAGCPIQWAHRYDLIGLGSASWAKYDKNTNSIIMKVRFGKHQFANDVFEHLKEHPLSMSIGFIPTKIASGEDIQHLNLKELGIDPQEAKNANNIFLEAELLEASIVPIPANPHCSMLAVSKGLITSEELKSIGYVYEIIDPDKEIPNGIQEEITEKTQTKEADSGTSSSSQEKEVDEFITFEEKSELVTKPDTANYIHIEVSKKHGDHTIRTISISDKQGIKAHYCTDCKEIVGYMFDTSKWSRAEAEKWVADHKKSYENVELECDCREEDCKGCKPKKPKKEFCECDEFSGEDDTCKACGGKRKPKKEVKAPQCQCTECDATCAPEDGKCDMNCPKCGASMSMSDDNEDNIEQDACKPKKPKKDINELGYNISDEEVENLVNQFEKMLDYQPVQKEVDEPTVSELMSMVESMNSIIENLKSEIKELKNPIIESKVGVVEPDKQKIETVIEVLKSMVEDSNIKTDTFIQLENDDKVEKTFIELDKIESKQIEDIDIDVDKIASIVEKSLSKALNKNYIDLDDLVYESLQKAKGKMFY